MTNVRRCLFPDVIRDEARIDNTANKMQELMNTEVEGKCILYNFDFKNDVPMAGRYIWYKKDDSTWIGRRSRKDENELPSNDTTHQDATEKNKFIPIQVENESTPIRAKDDSVPFIRKRRVDMEKITDSPVRRRIDYDDVTLRQSDF